jgi:hypothetical protein
MIRPLRRAHLLTWIALAVLLPVLLIAAISARRIAVYRQQPVPANPVDSRGTP